MNHLDRLTPSHGLSLSPTRKTDKNIEEEPASGLQATHVSLVEASRETEATNTEPANAKKALKEVGSIYGGLSQVQREDQTIYQALITPVLSFFNHHLSMGPQKALSIQEKSALLDRLFEKMLAVLTSLEVPNQPSLFLIYAHHNFACGQAKAEVARYLITKLSQLRVQLYSDQSPMAKPYSVWRDNPRKDAQLEDILTSQLCLLPTQLRSEVKPVDKVVVCCSEVLANYLNWPTYADFYLALQQAYLVDALEKGNRHLRRVVNAFSQQDGFHHVLTEIAFLRIRAEELGDQHGIIPVALTPDSYQPCLSHFIAATTVRIEDFARLTQQAQAGQLIYLHQGRHAVMLKLIARLFATSEEAKTALFTFWHKYCDFIEELKQTSAVPTALELPHIKSNPR